MTQRMPRTPSRARAAAPSISVVIPAYNAATTLAQTLACVRAQTFTDFEVIVVDDGSADATCQIARDFAHKDARFRLVCQANAGVAAARNAGLALARGEFIAPLDADDLWHADKLVRQVQRFATAGPGAVLVYSWSADIDATGRILMRRLDLDRFEGDVYAALVLGNFIGNASAPLIRARDLRAIGGWDPGLRAQGAQGCEDWQAYLRLAERGDFALAPGFLIGYRQSTAAMSRQVAVMRRSYKLVLAEARSRHPELPGRLFRWSQAAYDFYHFELLRELGANRQSFGVLASCVLADPSWLMRWSVGMRLKRWLRAQLILWGLWPNRPVERGPDFLGTAPDPEAEVSDGHAAATRREVVSRLRIQRSC